MMLDTVLQQEHVELDRAGHCSTVRILSMHEAYTTLTPAEFARRCGRALPATAATTTAARCRLRYLDEALMHLSTLGR